MTQVKTVIKQCRQGAVVRVDGRLQQNPQRAEGIDLVCNTFVLESAPSTRLQPSSASASSVSIAASALAEEESAAEVEAAEVEVEEEGVQQGEFLTLDAENILLVDTLDKVRGPPPLPLPAFYISELGFSELFCSSPTSLTALNRTSVRDCHLQH